MYRNKEVRLLLFVMCGISMAGVLCALLLSAVAGLLVFFVSILLIGSSLLFTHWRYQEIRKLSDYLRDISNGNYTLDVRDNYEGELSILKSNIYKVTLMLSEHHSLLKQDKIKLMEAISDISHQLKTPLTSMMVMVDLLNEDHLPADKRKEFTRSIMSQLERIEWLVSSLLKMSKIDAGTVVFKKDHIFINKLMNRALEPLLIPIDVKGQTVSITGDEAVSFLGDFNWTIEAFVNILKNCVEHTPIGGKLDISFAENMLYTEVVITDNGQGIPRNDLPFIFNRFYKGASSGEDSAGIGLAMSYSIIANQRGDIEVRSKEGEGTMFKVKFYR